MARVSGSRHFLEHYCEIHGKLGNIVYRRKRNGEEYTYEYIYHPKYEPTVLSRRSDCIVRVAAGFTNPQYKDYQSIIKKMYYYSPYFLYPGEYDLRCNTFFKIVHKGNYRLQINGGAGMVQHLSPRSKVTYYFTAEGEYVLQCYNGGMLYSERKVIVIAASESLEDAYSQWFEEHLAEVLSSPDPAFASLPIYHRYLKSKGVYLNFSGKVEDFVIYPAKEYKCMHSHKIGSYARNRQTQYFCAVMPKVLSCWQGVGSDFARVWDKYYNRWFPDNYRKGKHGKAIGRHHLWSKLVFKAAGVAGFDLKTLSPEHWLPGIDTLGDLLTAAGYDGYGMTEEERDVKIF
ncbi:MAG: hypothetical protein K9M99_11040 [Candidatus Cloacimonetes bacterium]|nr:hypothetical protein [Candidatus Cloacimonadota bacterium]